MHVNKLKRSSRKTHPKSRSLLLAIANVRDDGILWFRKQWGPAGATVHELRGASYVPGEWVYSDQELLRFRDELRLLWGGPAEYDEGLGMRISLITPEMESNSVMASYLSRPNMPEEILNSWTAHRHFRMVAVENRWQKALLPSPYSLPALLVLAYRIHGHNFRYCLAPECPAPYFIATRKDQKYCCEECAEYGKREAGRKWWLANRRSPLPK